MIHNVVFDIGGVLVRLRYQPFVRYLQDRSKVRRDSDMAELLTSVAGNLFKRLMYYTCDRPQRFLPEVTEALTAFELPSRTVYESRD